ncbi:hypothetical protein GQX74_009022 [Glossina fuscipes]|uniref:Uncharacterized protein n=1 Tax=Glossina palpalis gambiensis TaxID=67801 RepID=A0A1B0BG23_9MUSC|nr:hypothetical protein GQX74_009022 [Glossina fuscipes]
MSVSSNASSAGSSISGITSSNDRRSSLGHPNSDSGSDSSELTHILNRRQIIIDSQEAGIEVPQNFKVVNVYTEFHEFSRKQIKDYQKTFNTFKRLLKGMSDTKASLNTGLC